MTRPLFKLLRNESIEELGLKMPDQPQDISRRLRSFVSLIRDEINPIQNKTAQVVFRDNPEDDSSHSQSTPYQESLIRKPVLPTVQFYMQSLILRNKHCLVI